MKIQNNSTPYSLFRPDGGGSTYTLWDYHEDALLISYNNAHINGTWLSGGDFQAQHSHRNFRYMNIVWRMNGYTHHNSPHVGYPYNYVPGSMKDIWVNDSAKHQANAFSYGATGWNRARPGNPVAGLAVFTGELRDFLPSLPRRLYDALVTLIKRKRAYKKRMGPSGLGDAYLNVQFGWIPLLKDLRDMYELYQTLDKRLAQIEKDNGKGVRRRRVIKEVTTESILSDYVGNGPFFYWNNTPPFWTGGTSRVTTTVTNTEKVWFVGKFRYYIPDIGTSQWTKRTTRALFGANITPEAAWNLLPWTWLFDWFGNLGDVFANASTNAVDNLTADYAYIMRETTMVHRCDASSTWYGLGDENSSTFIPGGAISYSFDSARDVLRTRVAASPFGFGLQFDSLSDYQLGIAAALGISRWPS